MKRLKQPLLKFEIQRENEPPVIYMDDDEDAPVIFRVQDPQEVVPTLRLVALINFMSDFEVRLHNQPWKIERLFCSQFKGKNVFNCKIPLTDL